MIATEEWRQLSGQADFWLRRTWFGAAAFIGSFTALAARVDLHVPVVGPALAAAFTWLAFLGFVTTGFSLANYVLCSKLFRQALRRRFHRQGLVWGLRV